MKRTFAAALSLSTLLLASLTVFGQTQTQSRDEAIREIETKRAEIAVLEKKVIAVPDSDREEFASFLTQPQTGIIRLLPRELYDGNGKRRLAIVGGGAFYSFVRKTHEYGQGSDILLAQNELSVGFAGADYGLLLDLGDVSIEQVASNDGAARALLDYKPPVKEADVRAEARKLWRGLELSGFTFTGRVPAIASSTYLLRSISPERSDIMAVFRVVRRDADGSIILLYKVLKTFPKPAMERTPIAEAN
jgi:hypothetical protein